MTLLDQNKHGLPDPDGLKLDKNFSDAVTNLRVVFIEPPSDPTTARRALAGWLKEHPQEHNTIIEGVTRALADPAYQELLSEHLRSLHVGLWPCENVIPGDRVDRILQHGPSALDNGELAWLVLSSEQLEAFQAEIGEKLSPFWVDAVDDAMNQAARELGQTRLSTRELMDQIRDQVGEQIIKRPIREPALHDIRLSRGFESNKSKQSSSSPHGAVATELELLENRLDKEKGLDEKIKLTVILEECIKAIKVAHAGDISIVEAGTHPENCKLLRVVARSGEGVERMPYYVPAQVGITGRVMRTGSPTVVECTFDDPDFQAAISEKNPITTLYPEEHWRPYQEFLGGIRSAITIPLKRHDKVVGVLCLHCPVEQKFDPRSVIVVEAIARRAAIEISKLLEMEEKSFLDSNQDDLASLTSLTAQLGAEIHAPWPQCPEKFQFAGNCGRSENQFTPAVPSAPGEKLRELGTKLAKLAATLTGAYRAAVRLIGPDYESLVVIGTAGDKGSWPNAFLFTPVNLKEDTAASYAIRTERNYYLADTAQKYIMEGDQLVPAHYRPIEPEARCHASVLLRHEGHTLGVLSVDWKQPGACDGRSQQTLEHLAERFGFPLKAYRIDELDPGLDNLLAAAKMEGRDPDYQQFLQIVAHMVGARQGAIFLRNSRTDYYHVAASLLHSEWSKDNYYYEVGEGVTGWVLKHNRSVRVADLRDRKELHDIFPPDPPVWKDRYYDGKDEKDRNYTYLGVPVSVRDHVFGVIRLADAKYGFTSYDQMCVERAAFRLADLLEQYDQSRRSKSLNSLSLSNYKIESEKELAGKVFEILGNVIGECACWIRLLDQRDARVGPELSRLAVSKPTWESRTTRYLGQGQGIAGRTAQKNEMTLFDHPTLEAAARDPYIAAIIEEDRFNRDLLEEYRSIVCVPLRANSRVVGTLLVCRKNYRGLSPGDLSFIKGVADLTGPALAMAGDADVRKMEKELLEATNTFLKGLIWSKNPAKLERSFLARIGQVLNGGLRANGVALWVLDGKLGMFRFQESIAIGSCQFPHLQRAWVIRDLPEDDCLSLIVSEPESDRRLIDFLAPAERATQKIVEGCQGAIIPIGSDGQLIAFFLVVVNSVAQINHTRVRLIEYMLQGLPVHTLRKGNLWYASSAICKDQRGPWKKN